MLNKTLEKMNLNRILIFAPIFIGGIILVSLFLKTLVFFALCGITAILVYTRYTFEIPFKITPYLFIGVIISLSYGLGFTFLYMILGMIVPKMIGGGDFDTATFFYLTAFFLLNFVATLLKSVSLGTLGVIISVLDFFVILIGGSISSPEKLISGVLVIGINVFLFIYLGNPLMGLIG